MAEEHIASSLNAETSSLSKQKPVITLNAFGVPVGVHSTKLASRCGELVRTIVPISIKDWRAVPKEKKDELWNHLQDEFIVPQSYKDKCLKSMSEMMRKYRAKLRTKYLDPHTTHEDRLNNRPPGVRSEDWEAFVEHNSNPKTVERRKKNTDVRKKLNIYHASGRYGHTRLEERMKRQKKEDEPPVTRAKVRIEARKQKDDSIPSSVSSHMERVNDLLSSQDEVDSHDILKDPLTQGFGVDTRGCVRGVVNVISGTQIEGSSTALEKLATKENKVSKELTSIKNLEDQVNYVTSVQKKLFEELGAIKQMIEQHWPMRSGSQASVSFPPKMTELVAVSNTLGSDEHSMRLRPCKLMSWHQEVVAHGRAHIGNGTQFIHDKALPENTYKVTVDVIDKGDVDLPYPDGHFVKGILLNFDLLCDGL
ncbi:hypothetical protein CKAN_02703800 [Cinnamomum micranthum f. kanehirae]|uniref:Transposase Tnp1/En/Spm-like domain-containing protein n=1 Tax=Cinnamomum micranthum f. kanehirae TaxID=337451 RepID=A0A443Q3J1_9MAGN|nr:hypothetical protein CKAN_02703800 [Cinnamomum micranthum f. kanehirae]